MPGLIDSVDAQLEELFKGWNFLSTVLAVVLLGLTIYPLISVIEPDTHPLLLTRQATVSPVRQPGESAIYRSIETPSDADLKSGLNVKDPGTPRWHSGRDGDLRDIWRQVLRGAVNEQGMSKSQIGKIISVYGREKAIEHDMVRLSKHINVIGEQIKRAGGSSVAIFLPNSVELLVAIFAGAFYGFTPILIPYKQPATNVIRLLQLTNADYLIAAAGSIPTEEVKKQCKSIRSVTWVVEPSSRDMDWNEASLDETTWHELVDGAGDLSSELPSSPANDTPPGITTFWMDESPTSGEIVTFSQNNIVAAVGAQLSALPSRHRLKYGDLFLPADSLTSNYILVQTLAALYSNASVALNSVAGPGIELPVSVTGISPTVIAASAESVSNLHGITKSKIRGSAKKWALNSQIQALNAGIMPTASLVSRVNAPITVTLGKESGKLRLLYVFERTNSGSQQLTSLQLAELRAFTGARVIYALTAAQVAGTVAQTNIYDYRVQGKGAHFGVPLSCVEAMVVDKEDHKTVEDGAPTGELIVRGPAVLNGKANLGIIATFRDDSTLALIS